MARILGASTFYYSGDHDKGFEESVKALQERWGGNMEVLYTTSPRKVLKDYPLSIHLTMYGERVEEVIGEIREAWKERGRALIIIGSAKVPGWAYDATYNVASTNQPHSEVAALALFGHLLLEGQELSMDFERAISQGAKVRVVPQKRGKRVEEL